MSLPERKRGHHTVWQYYLAAWEFDGTVACLRKGRTFSAGTRGLAVRTDFYALKELSAREEAFIRRYSIRDDDPVARHLNEGWLRVFLAPFELRRKLESLGLDPAKAAETMELLESNTEEDLHAAIEGRAIKYLDALRADDLGFLQTDDASRGEFLHFLCVQYLRTPKRQEATIAAVRDAPDIRGDHIWPVLRHIYATTMALNMTRKWPDLRGSFLQPAPGSKLITSDQPVINLDEVGRPASEEVKHLAFYYPIGPTRALLIEDIREPRFEGSDLTVEEVGELNRAMIAMCHEQAFATSEDQLEALMP